jgi:hypothetical protein
MVLTYFLNDFEVVPVAPIIAVITLVFTFHIRCIYIVRSLYLKLLLLLLLLGYYNYHRCQDGKVPARTHTRMQFWWRLPDNIQRSSDTVGGAGGDKMGISKQFTEAKEETPKCWHNSKAELGTK